MLDPQVEGPADAGTAWMTANANARAKVILVNMVILLVFKPEAASADLIRERSICFRARIRMGSARYKSSCALRGVQFTLPSFVSATERVSPNSDGDVPDLRLRETETAEGIAPMPSRCAATIDVLREAGPRQSGDRS